METDMILRHSFFRVLAALVVIVHTGAAYALSPAVEQMFRQTAQTNMQVRQNAERVSTNPNIANRLLAQADRRAEANIQATLVRALTSWPKDGEAIAQMAHDMFPEHATMIDQVTRRTLPALSKRFGSDAGKAAKASVPYYVPRTDYARTARTTAGPVAQTYPVYPSYTTDPSRFTHYSGTAQRVASDYHQTIQSSGSPELPNRTGSSDPLEGFNRGMLAFNDVLDTVLLKPLAQGYNFILPEAVQSGVHNVFQNLTEPAVVLNNVLQGDLGGAGRSGARFIINSTFGLLGLFDVAAMNGDMPYEKADFGQTLYTYGTGEGPYVVLPILGPHTTRDAVGSLVDIVTDPGFYVTMDAGSQIAVTGTKIVSQREAIMPAYDNMKENSLDWYTTLRSSYLQNRRSFLEGVSTAPFEGGTYELSGNDPFDSFD